jgi:hypothetical protein
MGIWWPVISMTEGGDRGRACRAFGQASASADAMPDRAGGRPAWICPIRRGFNRPPEQIQKEYHHERSRSHQS